MRFGKNRNDFSCDCNGVITLLSQRCALDVHIAQFRSIQRFRSLASARQEAQQCFAFICFFFLLADWKTGGLSLSCYFLHSKSIHETINEIIIIINDVHTAHYFLLICQHDHLNKIMSLLHRIYLFISRTAVYRVSCFCGGCCCGFFHLKQKCQ